MLAFDARIFASSQVSFSGVCVCWRERRFRIEKFSKHCVYGCVYVPASADLSDYVPRARSSGLCKWLSFSVCRFDKVVILFAFPFASLCFSRNSSLFTRLRMYDCLFSSFAFLFILSFQYVVCNLLGGDFFFLLCKVLFFCISVNNCYRLVFQLFLHVSWFFFASLACVHVLYVGFLKPKPPPEE